MIHNYHRCEKTLKSISIYYALKYVFSYKIGDTSNINTPSRRPKSHSSISPSLRPLSAADEEKRKEEGGGKRIGSDKVKEKSNVDDIFAKSVEDPGMNEQMWKRFEDMYLSNVEIIMCYNIHVYECIIYIYMSLGDVKVPHLNF
jgi:hypothetical protein